MRKTMYHESVSRWRRRRHREVHVAQVPEQPGASRESVSSRITLQRALARLTPHQRAVLVLRYYEDLTERQTAEALGVAHGTVKSQTRHALKRLRELAPELAAFGEVAPGQRRTADK
ncbi:sigma-70 family RNA polymerase sigma factor [Nocardioides sp.]|uniref:sigma-70 family RNA polymerase sigma factor n=1 Tax=Nocardioides sp. TaxID=35761 RepID=UPI002733A880|nr:sigma-70 family RNA polymerase sigma factor [Nocardioides sp.]MDP3893268.1 sigma-70 family RNA polymerase sigma factor [Nocardioides sp.]